MGTAIHVSIFNAKQNAAVVESWPLLVACV